MPKNENSYYIKAYAAHRVLPLRTAQDRFKKNHPDVQAWFVETGAKVHQPHSKPLSPVEALAAVDLLQGRGPASSSSAVAVAPSPPAKNKPEAERTMEEHAEVEAWEMFTRSSEAARAMAKVNDISAAGFARTAAECHKLFVNARADRLKAEIQSRQYLPISEYEALLASVMKVMTVWESLGPELARELNPGNPGLVMRIIDRFKADRLNPVVRELMAA
jgi:hypothetical protein